MRRIATTVIPYTELEVATGNFDTSRAPIDRIVLHTMVGTWESAASRFDNPASKVSAHYGVKYDGGLIHWLEEYNTAYQAGEYTFNQRSIGIEHEDMGNYNDPRPEVLYQTSAKLVADICKFYNIPCDNQHIIRHHDVPEASTACPDALDTNHIISLAQAILQPMDQTALDKQFQVDEIANDLHAQGYITSADSTLLVKPKQPEGLRNVIKQLWNDLISNRDHAGKWNVVCDLAKMNHESTPQQIADHFKAQGTDTWPTKLQQIVNYLHSL